MQLARGPLNAQKTILVVDDDAGVLSFVSGLLVNSSYCVLTASGAEEALQQSRDYKSEIHLLLSDLQMPGMTGIDLAAQITRERPGLKVLLMSGYAGGMIVLNKGWHFLAKPFIPSQLRALVGGLISP
jgi:DNA-binding NtrC family response regulator